MRVPLKSFVPLLVVAAFSLAWIGDTEAQHTPGHEIDQMEVCLGCHDLGDDLEARVQHAPVQAGECSACHNPHVARYKKLLRERPGPL